MNQIKKWFGVRLTWCLILYSTCSLTAQAADLGGYLQLSNSEGKQIDAKILVVHRDLITIKLQSNQSEIQVERSIFDAATQKLIEAWEVEQAVLEDLEFGVSTKRFSSERKSSEARSWEVNQAGYSVRVKNSSDVAISGLEAKYLIVVKRQKIGRRKKSDHSIEKIEGTMEIATVKARKELKIDTRSVALREEKMNPGWNPSYGGIEESEDEFLGILVEFYWNNRLIWTESKPNRLINSYQLSKSR